MEPDLAWTADRCLRISFGDGVAEALRVRVLAADRRLRAAAIPGLVSLTPAYATILATFDPARLDAPRAEVEVRRLLAETTPADARVPRLVEVPVCYEGEFAPDLAEVARLRGLEPAEVVRLHAAGEYVVRFLGFSPGFPYLAGLPERLATPRLDRPRVRVAAGSVAIAGAQAGIYPHATPGGWRILGRTPLRLFDATRDPPATLAIGDRVRFVPIPRARFGG
jgi:KipI family sensor histidine kinase inhibitor